MAMRTWFGRSTVLGLIGAIVLVSALSVNARDNTSREYHLKAAFLRYVAKFVSWPEGKDSETEINICLLGEFPSMKGINSINGRIVDDKPILIRPMPNIELAKKSCQILYISKTEEENLESIITELEGLPVLTFGDMEGFARLGGGMNFYVANNKMAIEINQRTVSKSELTIADRMLRLVTIVPDNEDA